MVIGATNRSKDLDPALISRFDTVISFPLPDPKERAGILKLYAKQLSEKEINDLAVKGEGLSGRDLKDICANTERMWIGKLLAEYEGKLEKKQVEEIKKRLHIPFSAYLESLDIRREQQARREKQSKKGEKK